MNLPTIGVRFLLDTLPEWFLSLQPVEEDIHKEWIEFRRACGTRERDIAIELREYLDRASECIRLYKVDHVYLLLTFYGKCKWSMNYLFAARRGKYLYIVDGPFTLGSKGNCEKLEEWGCIKTNSFSLGHSHNNSAVTEVSGEYSIGTYQLLSTRKEQDEWLRANKRTVTVLAAYFLFFLGKSEPLEVLVNWSNRRS